MRDKHAVATILGTPASTGEIGCFYKQRIVWLKVNRPQSESSDSVMGLLSIIMYNFKH